MDQLLTDPEEAADFVEKTEVDALAIAIGTPWGLQVQPSSSGDILAIDRIKAIHDAAQYHLVMHGSSSVPQDLPEGNKRIRR